MSALTQWESIYTKLLSHKTKSASERIILAVAIASFLIHLSLIYLVEFGIIRMGDDSDLLSNPIAAIYTPFSFILLYEVYLLIYYLPKSFTTYIGKQYEIMTLIVIRRLFKDLSNLKLSEDWFAIKYDLQFTYDIATSIVMFFLIYLFSRYSQKKTSSEFELNAHSHSIERFVAIKKTIATALVPIFLLLALYSFAHWFFQIIDPNSSEVSSFTNINNIFFEQFFTILIFADVLLLLFSFFITDQFHKVIRNSGFIISTILLRISFSTTGLINNLLIICSLVFGLLIVIIHNRFEKDLKPEETLEC